MPVSRRLMTCLALLVALALAVPAATLASGGGSAGDQQYTDPFAGTPAPASHTQTGGTQTATLTETTPAAATTPAPTTTVAPSATATAAPGAGASSTTATTGRPATLPFTGYDGWLAAALGAGLVAGGIALRRRAHRT